MIVDKMTAYKMAVENITVDKVTFKTDTKK